jgi:DNA-binding XRE family transcriptional regulator
VASFNQQIRQARLDANRSQTWVAKKAGVSQKTISFIERGGSVTLDTAEDVAAALGLRFAWTLTRSGGAHG